MNKDSHNPSLLYYCCGIKDAYYFDNKKLENRNFITLILMRLVNVQYDALVSLRLYQYFSIKQKAVASCANLGLDTCPNNFSIIRTLLTRLHPILTVQYCWYYLLTLLAQRSIYLKYGLDIGISALIGKNFSGPFRNIAITGGTIIGENVHIAANVTIAPSNAGCPIIEDDVTVHTGAVIFGKINIGKGATIGANSLVLNSVEPYTTVVGVPSKLKFRKVNKACK
jgi:serine acetyltransferase